MRHALGASVGVTAGVGDSGGVVTPGVAVIPLMDEVMVSAGVSAAVTVQVGLEGIDDIPAIGVRVANNGVRPCCVAG